MRKRTYFSSSRRRALVRDALDTAREARAAIDPALLERARAAIAAAGGPVREGRSDSAPPGVVGKVPVDRRKILTIVMKFLALRPDNPRLREEVRSFLAEDAGRGADGDYSP